VVDGIGTGDCPGAGTVLPSVDVELVTLRVFHRYPVVIEALLGQGADDGGSEIRQPSCLGVDPLPARRDRDRTPAADVNVDVEAVLDRLAIREEFMF
jgi:hypothetical protein